MGVPIAETATVSSAHIDLSSSWPNCTSFLPVIVIGSLMAAHVLDRVSLGASGDQSNNSTRTQDLQTRSVPRNGRRHMAIVVGPTDEEDALSFSTKSSFINTINSTPTGIKIRNRLCVALFAALILGMYYSNVFSVMSDLYAIYARAPAGFLRSPTAIFQLCTDVKDMATADGKVGSVIALLVLLYITLQTFCIPGTILVNAVCGALLGVRVGLPLCVAAGTVGASCCYIMSSVAGTSLATYVDGKLSGGKGVPKLRAQVWQNRHDLFAYVLFLRLTPILPNWLINLASPVVKVPLQTFFLATMLGITPQTYISVRFGTLSSIDSVKSIVSVFDTAVLAFCGVLVLVSFRLRKRFSNKEDLSSPAPKRATLLA